MTASELYRKAEANRDDWLRMLAAENLQPPNQVDQTWTKWVAGDTQVIVRFGVNGTATLDCYWRDPDGVRNSMIGPRDCPSVLWLARDIARLLTDTSREVIVGLCRS